MIATHQLLCSNPPSPAQITEASLTGLFFCSYLAFLQSSLNTEATMILFKQESGCVIPLFSILRWLSRGLQGSSSWQPMANPQPHLLPHFLLLWTRPPCCFSPQINTPPSHELRPAVSSAWNTFFGEVTSKIPHFHQESLQMPIYQWYFSWRPYIKQQYPYHPILSTLLSLTLNLLNNFKFKMNPLEIPIAESYLRSHDLCHIF